MEKHSPKLIGNCPACSAAIPDGSFGGGIWTGVRNGKGCSGPALTVVCPQCGAKLETFPTHEELASGSVVWSVEQVPYPGEEFVATMGNDGTPRFLERIEQLVTQLKRAGFAATCPGDHTFAGVLVPSQQAAVARNHLSKLHIEYLRVWVSDEDGRPITYIGNPSFNHGRQSACT